MEFPEITYEAFCAVVTDDHFFLTMDHAELAEIGQPSEDAEEELEASFVDMMERFLSFSLGEEGTANFIAAFPSKEDAIEYISEQTDSGIYGIEVDRLFEVIDEVRQIAALHYTSGLTVKKS